MVKNHFSNAQQTPSGIPFQQEYMNSCIRLRREGTAAYLCRSAICVSVGQLRFVFAFFGTTPCHFHDSLHLHR